MATVYVTLIIKGLKTFDSVPQNLKPEVETLLRAMDLAYLVDKIVNTK